MPKTVSNRQLRRTVVAQQAALDEGVAPAIRQLAASVNDILRVAGEAHAMATPRPTLVGRLRWLLTGK